MVNRNLFHGKTLYNHFPGSFVFPFLKHSSAYPLPCSRSIHILEAMFSLLFFISFDGEAMVKLLAQKKNHSQSIWIRWKSWMLNVIECSLHFIARFVLLSILPLSFYYFFFISLRFFFRFRTSFQLFRFNATSVSAANSSCYALFLTNVLVIFISFYFYFPLNDLLDCPIFSFVRYTEAFSI